MSSMQDKIKELESEIDKMLQFIHELKEKNYFLIKENDDLKNKLSIFEHEVENQVKTDFETNENMELTKLKEKQERIKLELNGIVEHINSVLN